MGFLTFLLDQGRYFEFILLLVDTFGRTAIVPRDVDPLSFKVQNMDRCPDIILSNVLV